MKPMQTETYIHGYNRTEQQRLRDQARLLEEYVYGGLNFDGITHLLEVGSGVGAQTEILLSRYDIPQISCVELAPTQIADAKAHIEPKFPGRVNFVQAAADRMPFADHTFDGLFSCWFLEHIKDTGSVLAEMQRVLKPNGRAIFNEPINSAFHIEPYSPRILEYHYIWNDFHWTRGGNPFVGLLVATHLVHRNFQQIETKNISVILDNREPTKRQQYLKYWESLLLSSVPQLLEAGAVTKELVAGVKEEFIHLNELQDSVILDSWIRTTALAPNR